MFGLTERLDSPTSRNSVKAIGFIRFFADQSSRGRHLLAGVPPRSPLNTLREYALRKCVQCIPVERDSTLYGNALYAFA